MTPEFNKDGKVNKYFNLDEILKLNLSEGFKNEFKSKFNKDIYLAVKKDKFNKGKLIGLEINEKLYEKYYIIEDLAGNQRYISCENIIKLW